jgi:putative CocE/NonD family hydrolase
MRRYKFHAGRWIAWGLAAILGLAAVAIAGIALLAMRVKLPGEEIVPAGMRRNTSVYVRMRDGVEIAIDIWLPPGQKTGERVPVLMKATRYWRATQYGWAYRPMMAVGAIQPPRSSVDYFNRRGYAVLLIDARGSGASGGSRVTEFSPDEIADYGEIAHWASQQPWSNGRVGAYGVSYEGNTAELTAAANEPSFKATAPLFSDFDSAMLVLPNGVYTQGFLQPWSDMVAAMDRNDICFLQKVAGWGCWGVRQLTPGVKRVDSDLDGKHLRELLADRHNLNVAEGMGRIEFRDDPLGKPGAASLQLADVNPYGLRRNLESSGAAMQVWCGWLDAGTCEGALERYATFSNPQQLIIGPCSHGCRFNVDPFLAANQHTPANPAFEEQWRMRADFFDRYLKKDPPEKIESGIQYYTMGEGQWHSTTVWPPAEFAHSSRRYYFAADHRLSLQAPEAGSASDSYTVDFTATTGQHTRWHTQNGGLDVIYPDRREPDKRLLVYASAPLETDVEITGSPVITLQMASTESDGAIHVYLEDVAPEGRVTYLDEGIFRAINRKIADPKTMPFKVFGPAHSLLRADAEPLTSGQPAVLSFALFPTSLLLRKGHSIRVALAGADAPLFRRYPPEGNSSWTLYRQKTRASYIELPLRPR